MEGIAQREQYNGIIDELKKELVRTVSLLAALTFAYYIPEIFGGERDPECKMNTQLSNSMYAWAVAGPLFVMTLGFLIAYGCKKAREIPAHSMQEFLIKAGRARKAFTVISVIGAAIWFLWNQTLWSDMSKECLSGFNLMDFIIWCFLLLVTLAPTILACLFCICSPCICCVAYMIFSAKNEA